MKTLYLVRHAKSDWDNASLQDIDRPLNTRGYKDAHAMSDLLKKQAIQPDLIISSPAVRALTTALIFSRNFKMDAGNILILPDLYHTNAATYREVLGKMDDKYNSIMLFAHNPVISDLAMSLHPSFAEEMPTCAIAGIRFKSKSWNKLMDEQGEAILFDYPKNTR
ncbi:MAG: histidine phosphatase family protein [Bacteroidota bacterium]|nr:histidine phosphatase family protein [Bacteroidota bacterium]